MYVTPTMRQEEIGIMSVGLNTNSMGQWIPPGLSNAHNAAFMPSECTENAFPDEGIKVFGSILHAHTISKALNFRHIRNGKELEPIDTNLDYDFNYQQTIIFEEHKTILPGDELILDCWTDSSQRDFTTIGGTATSNEMCFVFFYYYPKVSRRQGMVTKSQSAMSAWMKDAQTAGFMSGTATDIDNIFATAKDNKRLFDVLRPDFSSLSYNGTMDGALDFYNRLFSVDYDEYNRYNVLCSGSYKVVNLKNVARNESFDPYDLGLNECDNVINGDAVIASECVRTGGALLPTNDTKN